jgi:hypothetical protein
MLAEKRTLLLGGVMVLLCAGIITAAVAISTVPGPAAAPTWPLTVTVPEKTALHVTLDQGISSKRNRPGDHFEATLTQPVVMNNKVVIPQGTPVEGVVVDATPSGHLMGRAHLQLALQSLQLDGKTYDLSTATKYRRGRDHKKRNWAWIGGGAGGGALIGAAAGGGKGALIGGPIGAGAGAAAAYFTGKRDIHLAPETRLEFRLKQPLTIETKS